MVRQVVTGSPAADGGLLVDDVILSVDGEAVESADALAEMVQAHEPGDVISLTISRDGTESDLEIELGTAPSRQRDHAGSLFASGDVDPLVAAEMVLHVELAAADDGYEVLADSRRNQSDLSAGDVITAVNGTPVEEVDWAALVTEVSESEDGTLSLTVQREGEEITVESSPFHGRDDGHPGKRQDSPRDEGSGNRPKQGSFSV
jgi:S1-C subfamily serine protease